jgi:hypothetical protein
VVGGLEETRNPCIILQGNILENVTRNGAEEVGLNTGIQWAVCV